MRSQGNRSNKAMLRCLFLALSLSVSTVCGFSSTPSDTDVSALTVTTLPTASGNSDVQLVQMAGDGTSDGGARLYKVIGGNAQFTSVTVKIDGVKCNRGNSGDCSKVHIDTQAFCHEAGTTTQCSVASTKDPHKKCSSSSCSRAYGMMYAAPSGRPTPNTCSTSGCVLKEFDTGSRTGATAERALTFPPFSAKDACSCGSTVSWYVLIWFTGRSQPVSSTVKDEMRITMTYNTIAAAATLNTFTLLPNASIVKAAKTFRNNTVDATVYLNESFQAGSLVTTPEFTVAAKGTANRAMCGPSGCWTMVRAISPSFKGVNTRGLSFEANLTCASGGSPIMALAMDRDLWNFPGPDGGHTSGFTSADRRWDDVTTSLIPLTSNRVYDPASWDEEKDVFFPAVQSAWGTTDRSDGATVGTVSSRMVPSQNGNRPLNPALAGDSYYIGLFNPTAADLKCTITAGFAHMGSTLCPPAEPGYEQSVHGGAGGIIGYPSSTCGGSKRGTCMLSGQCLCEHPHYGFNCGGELVNSGNGTLPSLYTELFHGTPVPSNDFDDRWASAGLNCFEDSERGSDMACDDSNSGLLLLDSEKDGLKNDKAHHLKKPLYFPGGADLGRDRQAAQRLLASSSYGKDDSNKDYCQLELGACSRDYASGTGVEYCPEAQYVYDSIRGEYVNTATAHFSTKPSYVNLRVLTSSTNTLLNITFAPWTSSGVSVCGRWSRDDNSAKDRPVLEQAPNSDLGLCDFNLTNVSSIGSYLVHPPDIYNRILYLQLSVGSLDNTEACKGGHGNSDTGRAFNYGVSVRFEDGTGTFICFMGILFCLIIIGLICFVVKRKVDDNKRKKEEDESNPEAARARKEEEAREAGGEEDEDGNGKKALPKLCCLLLGQDCAGFKAKLKEKAEAAKAKKELELAQPGPAKASCASKLKKLSPGEIACFIFLRIVDLFGAMLKVCFNVALLHESLYPYSTTMPAWPEVAFSMGAFGQLSNIFSEIVVNFNIANAVQDDWNCGGAKGFAFLFMFLVAIAVTTVVLSLNLLLFVAIKVKKFGKGKGKSVARAVDTASAFAVTTLLFSLQTLMTWCGAAYNGKATKHSCSDFDASVKDLVWFVFTQILVILCIVILIQFSGTKKAIVRHAQWGFGYPIPALLNIIMITFGIWTKQLEEDYDITTLAEKFDDDDEDDDNCHETVVSLMGKSRGTIWMAFGPLVILAKLAEALNDPVAWDLAKKLELETEFRTRLFKWMNAILTFLFTIGVATSAQVGWFVVLFISLIPTWLVSCYQEAVKMADAAEKVKKDSQVGDTQDGDDEEGGSKKKKKEAEKAVPAVKKDLVPGHNFTFAELEASIGRLLKSLGEDGDGFSVKALVQNVRSGKETVQALNMVFKEEFDQEFDCMRTVS